MYLSGHEHFAAHGTIDNSYADLDEIKTLDEMDTSDDCTKNVLWYNSSSIQARYLSESQSVNYIKGEYLHQVTLGNGGREFYDVCV